MNAALPVPALALKDAGKPTKKDHRALLGINTIGFYFVFKMAYFFTGGNVQPADMMLGTLAIFLTPPGTFERVWVEHRPFVLFIIWVIAVNIVWAAYSTSLAFLASASYYLFNLLIVCSVVATRARDKDMFDRVIIKWILASIVIQFAIVVGFRGAGRSRGSFNNPNQLAYWAVCVMSILLVLRRNKAKATDVPFQLMALWCQVGSASRAGLGASLMLFLLWAFFALNTPTRKLFGALGLAFIAAILAITPYGSRYIGDSNQLSIVENRLNRNTGQSEIEVRNYDRILNYYRYTVFGAGEGDLFRFSKGTGIDLEIHSSFGTVFFSYGAIGLTLFLLFLGNLARRVGVALAIYLVPALIYGLTHQGLRFTFFWLLIGLLVSNGSRVVPAFPALRRARPALPPIATRSFQERGPDFLRSGTGVAHFGPMRDRQDPA